MPHALGISGSHTEPKGKPLRRITQNYEVKQTPPPYGLTQYHDAILADHTRRWSLSPSLARGRRRTMQDSIPTVLLIE